jgi:GntR family transcriptional regulator
MITLSDKSGSVARGVLMPLDVVPLRSLRPRPSLTERAAEDLRRAIQDGHFRTGRLPAEPDLAKQLGVSRATLRHAISVLQEEGLVSRRQGSGTFIAGQAASLRNNLNMNFGVTDLIEAAGWRPGTLDLEIEEQRADARVSERLGLPPRSRVLVIHRTRTGDDRPVAHTVDMIGAQTLADVGLTADEVRRSVGAEESLYRTLERAGIIVHHGVAEIRPAKADRSVSKTLKVPLGALLLQLEQVDYTSDGEAILYSEEYYIADLLTVQVYRKGSGTRL